MTRRHIILTIEPDADGIRCGEECTGSILDANGCCEWMTREGTRGPECLAAEVKLNAMIAAGEKMARTSIVLPADEIAWNSALKAIKGGE